MPEEFSLGVQSGLTLEEKLPVVQALTLPLVSGSETTSPDRVWVSAKIVVEVLWLVE